MVIDVLERAGWYPGRDITSTVPIAICSTVPEPARDVYREYGFLALELRLRARPSPTSTLEIGSVLDQAAIDILNSGTDRSDPPSGPLTGQRAGYEQAQRIGKAVFHLGQMDDVFAPNDLEDIYIDEDGAIYLENGHLSRAALSFREFLEFWCNPDRTVGMREAPNSYVLPHPGNAP